MRSLSRFLALAVLLVASAVAFAATEMVILRDGMSGMAEVTATDADSISVTFQTEEGGTGETKLAAARLDPHCFYAIRSKHMEKTVENHIKLAVYCAENGMFNRADAQVNLAKKLDPAKVEELKAMPEIMEKIAQRLADAAKKAYDDGDLDLCRELAHLVATRFHETSLAEKAMEACDMLDAEMAKRDAAEVAAREKKIAEAADEAEKAAAEARHKVLVPIEKRQDAARKKNAAGLRAKNRSTAKRSFEAAAGDFESAINAVASARKRAGDDAELGKMLADLEEELKVEAVNAWVNAGNIDLWRESFSNARKAAEKALEVDPGSSAAASFKKKVEFAFMVRDTDRRR